MENVTTLENLLIRACKSRNPERRLHSVISRFYAIRRDEPFKVEYCRVALASICEKYHLLSLSECMAKYMHRERMNYLFGSTDEDILTGILIGAIQVAPVDRFPGYRKPRYFREAA